MENEKNPLPASASNKLIITAIAASSLPSDVVVGMAGSGIAELLIIRMISESESEFESRCDINIGNIGKFTGSLPWSGVTIIDVRIWL